MPLIRPIRCPAAPLAARPPQVPRPAGLACSITVPGEPHSAAIVRNTVRSALHAHGLAPHADLAQLAVTELVATAAKLTPGEDLYASVRYRAGALRIVLWDQHPRHRDPDAVSVCEERRRRSLWLLDAMAEEHGGDWGTEEAQPPHRGTKSWALLPCEGFAVRRTRSRLSR
ncbi:ATP-binding protein [Streptomyces sp. MUM 178J]|uniref:ATP-binding protein n=1 Tax=Streptomyces sp. MUM 178J TaxID=2791991 RepID=UPI001F04F524|nr:ATP-binding protein [Streptomyces sp. MUM 178J]WRQ81591.1 ATP-binding protein [Streptomyces sp. MUM 178J]